MDMVIKNRTHFFARTFSETKFTFSETKLLFSKLRLKKINISSGRTVTHYSAIVSF